MSGDYEFYGGTPPHQERDTSHNAAYKIEPSASTLRGRVLRWLRTMKYYGATDLEMQEDLAMNPSTQRPRRIELVLGGLVVDSGRRRRTPSGRQAAVWVAKEFHEST